MHELAEAFELIESRRSRCRFVGERGERLVSLAEETLGVSFPPSYRSFVRRFGAGNIAAEEIYGVVSDDF
jgi:antitoxin YobK